MQNALFKRWSSVEFLSSSESNEEYKKDTDDKAVPFSEKILLNDIGDLAEICKELGVQVPCKAKLEQIREVLSKHRAFRNVSESPFIVATYILFYIVYSSA